MSQGAAPTVPQAPGPRAPGRIRRPAPAVLLAGVTAIVLLAVWEAVPQIGVVNRLIFPTVSDTIGGLGRLVLGGYWWVHLWSTMTAVAVAYVFGAGGGFLVGAVLGVSQLARQILAPYIIAIQALPKIVLAPLLIGWLGFGAPSKIAIAVAICFFPTMINTLVGLSLATPEALTYMRALRAGRWQVFRFLQFPTALPLIFVGLKHSLLLAFTGVLVAETLAGAQGGLGQLAESYTTQLLMSLTFAVIVVVIIIAVLLVTVFDWLDRRIVFWGPSRDAKKAAKVAQ
jgi:NitT/TauT family transport system permease protein